MMGETRLAEFKTFAKDRATEQLLIERPLRFGRPGQKLTWHPKSNFRIILNLTR